MMMMKMKMEDITTRKRVGSVRALFGGMRGQQQEPPQPRRFESETASQEVLLLLLEQELNAQLTRALSLEAFDAAKEIRRRHAEVSAAQRSLVEAKGRRGGPSSKKAGRSSSSRQEAVDATAEGVRLRGLLQAAVEAEDYAAAASYRDRIKLLGEETQDKGISAFTSETEHALKLGEWIQFARARRTRDDDVEEQQQEEEEEERGNQGEEDDDGSVHGVIVGVDAGACLEEGDWIKSNGIREDELQLDFYLVLVHNERADATELLRPPAIAYVPESRLKRVNTARPPSLEHPYSQLLFLGQNSNGDYIPVKLLREKYGMTRTLWDDFGAENDDDDEDDDNDDRQSGRES